MCVRRYSVLLLAAGTFVTLDVPGAAFTEVWARDAHDRITGRYAGADGVFHIFQRGSDGVFRTIDAPGAAETAPGWYSWVGGANESGAIASDYCVAEPCNNPWTSRHGFVVTDAGFTPIDVPGAVTTVAFGLNARGDIAGVIVDLSGAVRSFVRSSGI
jgi:hypothetical protein